jgi:hypothetical protein
MKKKVILSSIIGIGAVVCTAIAVCAIKRKNAKNLRKYEDYEDFDDYDWEYDEVDDGCIAPECGEWNKKHSPRKNCA